MINLAAGQDDGGNLEDMKMKTETSNANDARQVLAKQITADYGAIYFNPLIRGSAGETCAKAESIMGLLYGLLDRDQVSEDMSDGIKLIVQTVWAAMQYERDVAAMERGTA